MNLVEQLKALVAREREINLEILRKLREVESAKIFAEMGYSSLHEFCVRELGYSEGAAARRVHAMRFLKEYPRVEEKIASGELNLTTVSELHRTFKKAEKENVELPKERMIEEVCGLSSREAEKVIQNKAAEKGLGEKCDEDFEAELRALLAHYSHAHPGMTKEQLFRFLVKEKYKSINPARPRRHSGAGVEQNPERRRPVAALIREIFTRDEGRCTYVSSEGHRCRETHFLELDHIVPVARGGLTKATNLRLRCRTHNQLTALRAGLTKRPPRNAAETAQARPPGRAP